MIKKRKSRNYVNNFSLLKEIQKSKMSFCSFIDEEHTNFDYIVEDIEDLTVDALEEAQLARDEKNKKLEEPIEGELVIRVMTDDHVPWLEKPGRFKKVSVNFPPFKHFVYRDGEWREVLRSHWKGGIENGEFSVTNGKLTDELAKMIFALVERYASKGNFSGYTYIDDMKSEALVHMCYVALKFNEAKSNNPFAYYTQIIKTILKSCLTTEKQHREVRDDLLMEYGMEPSFTRIIDHEFEQYNKNKK